MEVGGSWIWTFREVMWGAGKSHGHRFVWSGLYRGGCRVTHGEVFIVFRDGAVAGVSRRDAAWPHKLGIWQWIAVYNRILSWVTIGYGGKWSSSGKATLEFSNKEFPNFTSPLAVPMPCISTPVSMCGILKLVPALCPVSPSNSNSAHNLLITIWRQKRSAIVLFMWNNVVKISFKPRLQNSGCLERYKLDVFSHPCEIQMIKNELTSFLPL